jgi:hypothetical protein
MNISYLWLAGIGLVILVAVMYVRRKLKVPAEPAAQPMQPPPAGATAVPAHVDSDEEWRERSRKRAAEEKARLVHVAMGPIIGAILIANLITSVALALLYAVLRAM